MLTLYSGLQHLFNGICRCSDIFFLSSNNSHRKQVFQTTILFSYISLNNFLVSYAWSVGVVVKCGVQHCLKHKACIFKPRRFALQHHKAYSCNSVFSISLIPLHKRTNRTGEQQARSAPARFSLIRLKALLRNFKRVLQIRTWVSWNICKNQFCTFRHYFLCQHFCCVAVCLLGAA